MDSSKKKKCKRCEAINADGARCGRKISCNKKCLKYCWQHADQKNKFCKRG